MKPSMTPAIRSSEARLILVDIQMIIRQIHIAPIDAAILVTSPVPNVMVAIATPVPAPALTPRICGSANGFLNTACICAPEIASPAPARIAVMMRGSLSFRIIACTASPECPIMAWMISAVLSLIAPI